MKEVGDRMKVKTRIFGVAVLSGLGLVLPASSPAADGPLADRVEAVIVKGRQMPSSMLGGANQSYRVFADLGSGLSAIPFQIDERDSNGIILVSQGPYPDKVNNQFDPQDELVFMAKDSGQSPGNYKIDGCPKTAEIKIADRKTGATGYVVLAQCENPPPFSTKDYVRFDSTTRTVVTDRYNLGYKMGDVYPYDYITINNGPDLLDRLKVRAVIGKWGINYTFNEDHFRHKFIGYKDGPVRVIYKSDDCWSLGPLGKIAVPQYLYFYQEYARFNDAVDARMNPALFGLDLSVMISHDYSVDRGRGYVFCGNVSPGCEPVGTIAPERVKSLTEQHMDWGGISGPEGALLTHLVPDSRLTVRVKGIYVFDENLKDPPEYIKGSSPKIGFNLVDWKNVKPAIYDLDFYHMFLTRYSIEEFSRFDRLVTNPLEVSIK
jgi:hypothetical protein